MNDERPDPAEELARRFKRHRFIWPWRVAIWGLAPLVVVALFLFDMEMREWGRSAVGFHDADDSRPAGPDSDVPAALPAAAPPLARVDRAREANPLSVCKYIVAEPDLWFRKNRSGQRRGFRLRSSKGEALVKWLDPAEEGRPLIFTLRGLKDDGYEMDWIWLNQTNPHTDPATGVAIAAAVSFETIESGTLTLGAAATYLLRWRPDQLAGMYVQELTENETERLLTTHGMVLPSCNLEEYGMW